MRTTQLNILIMATLTLFSTITSQVNAQNKTMASMTIRAEVIESSSVNAVQAFKMGEPSFDVKESTFARNGFGSYSLTGAVDSEIVIRYEQVSTIDNSESHTMRFTPSIKINGKQFEASRYNSIRLGKDSVTGPGSAMIYIEGSLTSPESVPSAIESTELLVAIEFN